MAPSAGKTPTGSCLMSLTTSIPFSGVHCVLWPSKFWTGWSDIDWYQPFFTWLPSSLATHHFSAYQNWILSRSGFRQVGVGWTLTDVALLEDDVSWPFRSLHRLWCWACFVLLLPDLNYNLLFAVINRRRLRDSVMDFRPWLKSCASPSFLIRARQ